LIPGVLIDEVRIQVMFYPQCPKCEYEGAEEYSLVDPAIVRCPQCGHIYSFIWCGTCATGGDFIDNIVDRPKSWTCADCGTTQQIPSEAYAEIQGVDTARFKDSVEGHSMLDENYISEIEAKKNNPYRRPVFFSFGIVTVLALVSCLFVEDVYVPLIVTLLVLTAMFGYIVVMGYKTGTLPAKSGDLIMKKREPVYFYISYSFLVLAVIFLLVLSLIIIYSKS